MRKSFCTQTVCAHVINSVTKLDLLRKKKKSAARWVFWSESSWYLTADVCFDPSACSTDDLFFLRVIFIYFFLQYGDFKHERAILMQKCVPLGARC